MAFCTTCGTQNEDSSLFCANCGSNMKGSDQQSANKTPPPQSYENSYVDKSQIIQSQRHPQQYPQQQPYSPYGYQSGQLGMLPPRTGWLTFVIVMYWISVALLGFGGLFLLSGEFYMEGAIYQFIPILLLVSAALIYRLIRELNKYNNTARKISIILSVLGILGSISPFNSFNLAFSGLMVYALAFEQETIALFKPEQRFRNQHANY